MKSISMLVLLFVLQQAQAYVGQASASAPIVTSIFVRNNTILILKWRNFVQANVSILEYKIMYRELGILDESWRIIRLDNTRMTTVSIKQLKPLAVYEVMMTTRTTSGESPPSKPIRITMGRLPRPSSPNVTLETISTHSVAMRWQAPLNARPVETITCYEIQLLESLSNVSVAQKNVTGLSAYFSQLEAYTLYTFRVRAFTHETAGDYSQVIHLTTLEEAPSAPLNLTSSNADSNCITLTWNQPDICHGLLRHYDVQWSKNRVEWNMEKGDGNQTRIVIKNLNEYTLYHFRVRGFTVAYGNWSEIIKAKTMSRRPLLPPEVTLARVVSPQSVLITWAPLSFSSVVGHVTSYKIIYTDDIRQTDQHWRSKVVSGSISNVTIEGLRADTVYFFKVAAKTEKLGPFSARVTERTDQLGLPPAPYDEQVFNVTSSSATIGWSVKKGYKVSVVKLKYLSREKNAITPQLVDATSQNQVHLSNLNPNSSYVIELAASNYVGDSTRNPVVSFWTKPSPVNEKIFTFQDSTLFKTILGVLIGLLIVIVVMVIAVCIRCRRKPDEVSPSSECRSQVEMDSLSTFLRASTFGSQGSAFISRSGTLLSCQSIRSSKSRAPSTHSNQIFPEQFVLPWADILLEDVCLGAGNFGLVMKAKVRRGNELVVSAVKTLKGGCSLDDKKDFLAELDVMSRIGEHQNVVSLLGACEHDGSMFLCTEYAPNGNLLKFLRNSRRSGEGTITQSQLLTFATDVAEGMTYLSDKQIIHRDLAARNILLGEGFMCKISDFGLSRGEGVYVKKNAARLPIRWMAIESLNYNVYTSKSDVWSFGVLLWEIISLGGTPYCGMSCAELYEKLPRGFRMEKPVNCDDEVYSLMYQCWKDRPYDRPNFSQLCVALERMRDARTSRSYVNTSIFGDFPSIDVTEEEQ